MRTRALLQTRAHAGPPPPPTCPPQVTLQPRAAPGVAVLPSPTLDPHDFPSIGALASHVSSHGYYGGTRLLLVRVGFDCVFFVCLKRMPSRMPSCVVRARLVRLRA